MENFLRVKGIIKKDDKYLLAKDGWMIVFRTLLYGSSWMQVNHGEAPDDAVLRAISELLSIEGKIEKLSTHGQAC